MTALRVLLSRLADLFLRRRRERHLADEIRAHLEALADDHIARGMSPEQAARTARRAFGGVDQITEIYRRQRGIPAIDAIALDLRFALRQLLRSKGFAAVALGALALGIGVGTAFFTIVNASCLRGLPIERPERVVFISSRDAQARPKAVSYRDFADVRSAVARFASLAAYATGPVVIGDAGRVPDRVSGSFISTGAFALLGRLPVLGREFSPEDDRAGAPSVVILGDAVWYSRYGADPAIVGRTVRINGGASTVIGVMPAGFRFPANAELWQPLSSMPALTEQPRDARTLAVFGRLAPEASPPQARAAVDAVAAALAERYPATNTGITFVSEPINEHFNGRLTDPVWMAFMTAGVLVLLVACANVANLLLMRSVARTREIAVRTSMGATRFRIVRQLLVESAVLSFVGGVLGLALSSIALRLLVSTVPISAPLPYWIDYSVDGRVLLGVAVACLANVFMFGLVPALQASSVAMTDVLTEGGRTASGGRRTRRLTAAFLAVEFALAFLLLTSLAANVNWVRRSEQSDVQIEPSRLVTGRVTLTGDRYRTPIQRAAFYRDLEERIGGIAGVSSAAIASGLPSETGASQRLAIAGRLVPDVALPEVSTVSVSSGYFTTVRLALRAGRAFTNVDGIGQETAIVSDRVVEMHFPRGDAIGQRIRLVPPKGSPEAQPWLTIVGVSASGTARERPDTPPDPIVYLPFALSPVESATLLVSATADPGAAASAVRDQLRNLDPDLPLYRLMTWDQAVKEQSWAGRTSSRILYTVSAIAFFLALVGLYAVTAHAVFQRTHEIGIRMAMGARPRAMAWLVIRSALIQLSAGLVLGIIAVLALRPFGAAPANPVVLAGVSAIVVVVSIVACLAPALRAARLDPVHALRQE